jgi:NTP pyrophosphatase (non-canonical NTP hydrolase)
MTLDELQEMIARMYSRKDEARGVEGTFMWLMEEIGELAAALRESPKVEIAKEFADVLAWLATIANVADINLTEAMKIKYGDGCPGCGNMVCECADSEKP